MRAQVLRAVVVAAMVAGSACVLRAQSGAQSGGQSGASATVARDQRRITVAIAARSLANGQVLADSDIVRRDTVITWRWATEPDTAQPAAGWVVRRVVQAGEVLRAPAVIPPPVVTAGATVTAIWQDGAVRVALTGTATNTAALGTPVGVRLDRTRRLDGIAIGPNTVRLR